MDASRCILVLDTSISATSNLEGGSSFLYEYDAGLSLMQFDTCAEILLYLNLDSVSSILCRILIGFMVSTK